MEKTSPDYRTKTEITTAHPASPRHEEAEGGTSVNYALEHLAIEGEQEMSDDITDREYRDEAQTLPEAPLETPLASDALEEIEMVRASLPDPHIEAGTELLSDLGSIPEKMAFKIGEAAEMVGVKQYVLRYWETEFDVLRPRKSKNNQRVYSRRDVETAMMIKKLLYEDRFSIEGARSALRGLKNQVKEEKKIKAITESQETAVSKIRALAAEIRRTRDSFI